MNVQAMDIQAVTTKMKADSSKMAALSLETRNNILKNVKEALLKNKEVIFKANKMDMDAADENGVTEAVKKRLKFDEGKLSDVVQGIEELIRLDDPIGKTQFKRQLDEGLTLHRITCPIGVVGIIFEARPDALVQISSLCIKSGNCAVLKGGKETTNTNKILFQTIYQTAVESGAPEGCMYQAELHSEIDELLACHKSVDLLIPRGSNKFVQYIMNNTKIPVMGHADGICHTYLDKDADMEKAVSIIVDAKTQYTAALAESNKQAEENRRSMEKLMKIQEEQKVAEEKRRAKELEESKIKKQQEEEKKEREAKLAEEKRIAEEKRKAKEAEIAKKNAELKKKIDAVKEELNLGKVALSTGDIETAMKHFEKASSMLPVDEQPSDYDASVKSEIAQALYEAYEKSESK